MLIRSRTTPTVSVILIAAIAVLGAARLDAAERRVPSQYPTIQAAIDASNASDIVLVEPGRYTENLVVDRVITLRGVAGATSTIVDGGASGTVLTATGDRGAPRFIEGFTFTNGSGTSIGGETIGGALLLQDNVVVRDCVVSRSRATRGAGLFILYPGDATVVERCGIHANEATEDAGGAYVEGSRRRGPAPEIRRCSILGNSAGRFGGGVFLDHFESDSWFPAPAVYDCVIADNHAALGGGGIWSEQSAEIRRNRITRNRAEFGGGAGWGPGTEPSRSVSPLDAEFRNNLVYENRATYGGGVFSNFSCGLVNNTICHNTASSAGGGVYALGGWVNLFETIVWENDAPSGPQLHDESGVYMQRATHCDIQGGFPGPANIDADPMFVRARGDYRLRLGSPCVDAGYRLEPCCGVPMDFESDPRPQNGDRGPARWSDIGADELVPEIVARFGSVNAASPEIEDVLFVNGTAGDATRTVRVPTRSRILVEVSPSSAGPNPAAFAMYAWIGDPSVDTLVLHPYRLGIVTHSTPLAGPPRNLPTRTWNNLGHEPRFGTPDAPSTPAPSILIDLVEGLPNPLRVTLQGFLLDNGTIADAPLSITNAVVIHVGQEPGGAR